MDTFIQKLTLMLDWLFEALISPCFTFISRGLEFLILKPLEALQVPILYQVILVAMIAALLSRFLRRFLKVEEKELLFQENFGFALLPQEELRLVHVIQIAQHHQRNSLQRTIGPLCNQLATEVMQHFPKHSLLHRRRWRLQL